LSQDLLETYKGQGKLHRRYAFQILLDILQYFTSQPTLVDVTIPHGTGTSLLLSQHNILNVKIKNQQLFLSHPALTKLTIQVPSKGREQCCGSASFWEAGSGSAGKQDPDQAGYGEKVEALEGHFGTLEGPNLGKSEWYHIER
jgi:hypothetical protein